MADTSDGMLASSQVLGPVGARVAQTAEQLTRNEQVRSSILLSGSTGRKRQQLTGLSLLGLVSDRYTLLRTALRQPSQVSSTSQARATYSRSHSVKYVEQRHIHRNPCALEVLDDPLRATTAVALGIGREGVAI